MFQIKFSFQTYCYDIFQSAEFLTHILKNNKKAIMYY